MARPASSPTEDTRIESPFPGVASADPHKGVRQNLQPVFVRNGFDFSDDSILNVELFPPPYATGWAPGWVSIRTRRAMDRHFKVFQTINNLKNAVVGDGGRWIPAVNPYGPRQEEWDLALKYYLFLEHCYRFMQGSKWQKDRELLACMEEGNKIAAITTRVETDGPYKGKWVLDTINVWPEGSYELRQDEFGNFVSVKVLTGDLKDQKEYPKEKFLHLAWRTRDGNPYGSVIYAPCYEPFLDDMQAKFEHAAYMATWGRPSVVILAAVPPEGMIEEEMDLFDVSGKPIMEPNPDYDPSDTTSQPLRQARGTIVEQNGIMFTDFRAGTIWSLQGGSKVEVKAAQSGGADVFEKARKEARGAIADAIYGTRWATEGDGGPTAAGADLTEGVSGLNVTEGKVMLEQMDENQLGLLLLTLNYGPVARHLLPIRDLGSGQNGRLPKIMNAQVGFASNRTMTRAQYWDFCAANGLPLPWPGDEPASQAMETGTGGGDKTGGSKNKPTKPRGEGQ